MQRLRVAQRCPTGSQPARPLRFVARSSSDASSSAVTNKASTTNASAENTISALDSLLPTSTPTPAASSASTPERSQSQAPKAPPKPVQSLRGMQAAKKSQEQFEKVMAFEGLAPEVINGRAAMLGFMAAIAGEVSTGESLFAQTMSGGFLAAAAVIAFVVIASFAPAIRQVPMETVFNKDKKPKEFGPFNPNAEMINGRAAMIGLAALMFFEGASNYAFFM